MLDVKLLRATHTIDLHYTTLNISVTCTLTSAGASLIEPSPRTTENFPPQFYDDHFSRHL